LYDYGEACPISKATSVLCERWTLQIVREMFLGATRFSDFQKVLPKISPSLLNSRLKLLADNGIIVRKRIPEQRGYEYCLTPAGKSLEPLMTELGKWGIRWVYDGLNDEELDAAQFAQHFSALLNIDGLPSGDTVIQVSFTDISEMPRVFVTIRGDKREVCDENPGHEIDVYVRATLRTLTEILLGDISLQAACDNKSLQVLGPPVYTRNLARWFPVSQFAKDNPRMSRKEFSGSSRRAADA
jgi:DNA-binding HxlR family transcriptional regulator